MLKRLGAGPELCSPPSLGPSVSQQRCCCLTATHGTCSSTKRSSELLNSHHSSVPNTSVITRAATLDSPPSQYHPDQAFQAELDQPYPVTQAAVDFYATNGYVRLHNIFTAPLLEEYSHIISHAVQAADQTPLETDDDYAKAFTQIMNIWETNDDVKRLVFSNRLGSIAAQLLEVAVLASELAHRRRF